MERCLDSSFTAPTLAAALAARAAGVGGWWGYLATRDNVGLAVRWERWQFDIARLVGDADPVGFCSGRDDPHAVRQLAAAWGIRPALDVEDGIRPDGPWVQGWLDSAGAGLYGVAGVHSGRRAAFHVVARYPRAGEAASTWDPAAGPRPSTPCGWQSRGTHTEFGLQVDSGWYDDWFVGAPMVAASAGEGLLVRIPGPQPGTFHLFGVSHGVLVRVSSLAGGLGGLERWLSQPGNGWVDHGAPPDLALVAGGLFGGRGLDGNGADRVEVHALASDGRLWTLGMNDGGTVTLPWEPLAAPTFDLVAGEPGPPGKDVRPAVADALAAAVDQLRKAS